ncbi:hypothetical protein DN748_10995 [Sinomicrobium soli]|nr:hypothetical protein DN748_10995 [Sinomicrobium sp. N-1-3-6]
MNATTVLSLVQSAVFMGGIPCFLLKHPAEMLRVFKPEFISDLADGFRIVKDLFLSDGHDL